MAAESVRQLLLVFGDQLTDDSALFDAFDSERDAVLMIEAREEATVVRQHKHRLVLFFSAMRHFRDALRERGIRVFYSAIDDPDNRGSFGAEIPRRLRAVHASRLVVREPGDERVRAALVAALADSPTELDIIADDHFLCSTDDFSDFADGRSTLTLEHFYRWMRRRHDIMLEGGEPAGGRWNFDQDNRRTFGAKGAPAIPAPRAFAHDDITTGVADLVERLFPQHPGSTATFDWPVTRDDAEAALLDFVANRLAHFGTYQDAMVAGRPWLYHSRLSPAINLHLLDPRRVIDAAVAAWRDGAVPINSAEGFVRQVLGWREFIRGIYWREMPNYHERNALDATLPLPALMWTGDTDMACLRACLEQVIEHAFAHHIQRLMVLGLFALLLGVRPREFNDWHMAMSIDAVDWVSAPNVIGMSQYADGGLFATKPYCASGRYIKRMSNYCSGCRFNPDKTTGEDACPFNTLYWDFLSRNRNRLRSNNRLKLQFGHLDNKNDSERRAIRRDAERLRESLNL